MEPRLRGRFHIWHMLTREMPFCNLCASKDGTFERENCAPKTACAVSGPRSRVRDIFGAGNHHSAVLNGSADVYTGKASEFVDKMNSKTRELCSDRDTAVQFQKTKQTKTPVSKGRGSNQWRLSQRIIARIRNRSGTRKKTKMAKTTIWP